MIKLFIIIDIIIIILIMLSLSRYKYNIFAKNIVFCTILLMPYVSAYFPRIRITPSILLTGPRFFLLTSFCLLIAFIIKDKFEFEIPKYIKWIVIYLVFSIVNRYVQNGNIGHIPSITGGYILPISFLLLIENLNYHENDLKRLTNILIIVAIGTFLVSFIQLTISPSFYRGNAPLLLPYYEQFKQLHVVEDIYRNGSIFRGMGHNTAGISIPCLVMFFMFLNTFKYNKIYMAITLLLIFSGTVTFARYVWVSMIIVIIGFLYYKYNKRSAIAFGILALALFISWTMWFSTLESTDIYQKRVISKTYMSRINDPITYFTLFFPQKPFLGYGMSSSENQRFTLLHNIIHNRWIEIMFKDGLIGLFIFSMFVYHIYKRGRMVFKATGNPVFMVFVANYIITNLFGAFPEIRYYGYYVMLLYLAMNYKLYVERVEIMEKSSQKNLATI